MLMVSILSIVALGVGVGLQSTVHSPARMDTILAINNQIVSTMEQMKVNALNSFSTLAGYTDTVTINNTSYTRTVGIVVAAMLVGADSANRYVITTGDALWQVEDAVRRISHNLQTASSLDAPGNTTATNAFTVHTQADASNGNATYQVVYALSGTNLTETDSRYGTNTLVHNVTSFSVTRQSMASPVSVQITITVGAQPPVTRTFVVLCRNL
jgi:hypothetical protein